METQTRLSRHNKFISAENIVGIFSVSSDDSLHALYCPRDIYIFIYLLFEVPYLKTIFLLRSAFKG